MHAVDNVRPKLRTMATRKKFSRERLEAAGERSEQAALVKLGEEFRDVVSDVRLVCRQAFLLCQKRNVRTGEIMNDIS